MRTYNGMERKELIEKVVEARVKECRLANFRKFGNNDVPRVNENPNTWRNLYKTYPMISRNGMFCLVSEYQRFYGLN